MPFAEAFDQAQKNTFLRFINPVWPLSDKLLKLIMPWKPSMGDHLNVVDTFARGVIEKRREEIASGQQFQDLLSRFMNANNNKGDPLSNDELRDIVLNFVIAGRDTTAQALSWAFYMLACHPRVERKLYQEIVDNVTEEVMYDSPALFEVIKNMKYAHAL